MSEVIELAPALTYSPDGILTVARGPIEEARTELGGPLEEPTLNTQLENDRDVAVERLINLPGVAFEANQAAGQLTIYVPETFQGLTADKENGNQRIDAVLRDIAVLQPVANDSRVDRVLRAPRLSSTTVRMEIDKQFQLWLSASGLSEEAARVCLLAMAFPYSDHVSERQIRQDFEYRCAADSISGKSNGLEVTVLQEEVGFQKVEWVWDKPRKSMGKGPWQSVLMGTYRERDCRLDADPATRQRIRDTHDTKWLYSMYGHNLNRSTHALSLLLGMGSLAHNAASYAGKEDIFADVQWAESGLWFPDKPPKSRKLSFTEVAQSRQPLLDLRNRQTA